MSKGDNRRPSFVRDEQYATSWKRIFGRKLPVGTDPDEPLMVAQVELLTAPEDNA